LTDRIWLSTNYWKIGSQDRNGSFEIKFALNATRIVYVLLLSLGTLHPMDLCSREGSGNRESLDILPRES
jgi:hypothetical protein